MKILSGHVSEETAYIVEDYPWGFKLRTKQRHWIETKKCFGQRCVTQTVDPKTGRWCNPKYGTYHLISYMFLDDDGHLKFSCFSEYTDPKKIVEFYKEHYEEFSESERAYIKLLSKN